MRILFFFCDMLRPDKVEKGAVFNVMQKLGGIWFTQAYTPTPETPRAMAAYYTGLYPAENGCTKRGQWPYYFMSTDCDNLFKMLHDSGYNNYYYASPYSFSPKEGIVPSDFDKYSQIVFDYKDLIRKVASDGSENLCVHAGFDDYHDAVDFYSCGSVGSHDKADAVGQEHLENCINQFLNAVGSDFFDKIIIFSDHGCMLKGDGIKSGDQLSYVGAVRTGITLFIHDKKDIGIKKIDQVVSLLDIFPTVALWIGKKVDADGIPLQNLDDKRELVVEDIYHYRGVDNFIFSSYNLWSFINDEFYYSVSLEGKERLLKRASSGWEVVCCEDYRKEIERFISVIKEKSCFYSGNVSGYKIIDAKGKAVGSELLFKTEAAFGSKYNATGRRVLYTDGSEFKKTAGMRISRKLADLGYQWQRIADIMKKEFKELFKLLK